MSGYCRLFHDYYGWINLQQQLGNCHGRLLAKRGPTAIWLNLLGAAIHHGYAHSFQAPLLDYNLPWMQPVSLSTGSKLCFHKASLDRNPWRKCISLQLPYKRVDLEIFDEYVHQNTSSVLLKHALQPGTIQQYNRDFFAAWFRRPRASIKGEGFGIVHGRRQQASWSQAAKGGWRGEEERNLGIDMYKLGIPRNSPFKLENGNKPLGFGMFWGTTGLCQLSPLGVAYGGI